MKRCGLLLLSSIFMYQQTITHEPSELAQKNINGFDTQLQIFKQMVESEATVKQLKKDVATFASINKLRKSVVDSAPGKAAVHEQILKIWKSIQKEFAPIFKKKPSHYIDIERYGVDAVNSWGETVLILVAIDIAEDKKEALRLAQLLLDNDASINKSAFYPKAKFDLTPLMAAAGRNFIDMMKLLIRNGANVNYKSQFDDTTALTKAIYQANMTSVELLLNSKANLCGTGETGKTYLEIARESYSALEGLPSDFIEKEGLLIQAQKIIELLEKEAAKCK